MLKQKPKKIIVAMSGGVDSSVAAKLLVDHGHEVVGIFLHFWHDTLLADSAQAENKCCSVKAFMDARRVCQKIGIPLYTLNFSKIFKKEVVDNFLREYKRGHTPNPCVRCNKLVKLGLLIERAADLGFDYAASGHYVRSKKLEVTRLPARQGSKKLALSLTASKRSKEEVVGAYIYKLYRAKDRTKDQSYFLWTLKQEQLKRLLFPIGDYTKAQVRKMAKKFNLPVAKKLESQEICFIPGKSHNEFLKRHIRLKKGAIKNMDGKKVGEHYGLPLYTVGQRRGIEIGGVGPFYVARCDYKTNTLYVVQDGNDPRLFSNELIAKDVNWISNKEPKMPLRCEAVIRYRHKPVQCRLTHNLSPSKGEGNRKGLEYLIKFKEPQRAVTAGQSVVFYKGDEVLGGGIIDVT